MTLLAINSDKACAADPDMLQDICPADLTSTAKVNGFPCKNTSSTDDFTSRVLLVPGVITNGFGFEATRADVQSVPGLNTLGVSMARVDYAPGGITPPHIHPRASQMIYVLQGEVFVIPRGLVHYQKNTGRGPATIIAAFNSQSPGTQGISTTLFRSSPPIPNEILAQTFRTNVAHIALLRAIFA
ncbi:Nectarin-1 [Capsicum baccatum]|uniref:Germin-like protein n=1 Tax=Capsicum baccatum TaxID=33114 RepID=A0A2G2W8B6_CAPBA|nr:Nectarin-1 [Capsicum baccatum]